MQLFGAVQISLNVSDTAVACAESLPDRLVDLAMIPWWQKHPIYAGLLLFYV